MKNQTLIITFLLVTLTSLQSCAFIGGVFKTGMGVGIFLVVAIIALILFLVSRAGKK